jgi:hypothetical protein
VAFAAAFRCDAQQTLDVVLSSVEKVNPKFRREATVAIRQFKRSTGVDLGHGLLDLLGDTCCIYNSPSENGMIFTGLTAVVPLRDAAATIAPYGRLMAAARQWADGKKEKSPIDALDFSTPRIEQFSFGGTEVYCLNSGWLAPAWCMTKGEMVASLSPQNVKAYLARDGGREPIGRLPRVAGLFSGSSRPVLVAYADSPRIFELLYPWLMMYGPFIATSVRESYYPKADLSLMPSGVAVSRHLGPSIAALRRTDYGIEFVSRGTIPLPSATALCANMLLSQPASPFAVPSYNTGKPPPAPVRPVEPGVAQPPGAAATAPGPAAAAVRPRK